MCKLSKPSRLLLPAVELVTSKSVVRSGRPRSAYAGNPELTPPVLHSGKSPNENSTGVPPSFITSHFVTPPARLSGTKGSSSLFNDPEALCILAENSHIFILLMASKSLISYSTHKAIVSPTPKLVKSAGQLSSMVCRSTLVVMVWSV